MSLNCVSLAWIGMMTSRSLRMSPLLLVACLLGILAYWISRPEHAKIQRVVGRYATLFIASGLVLTIWLIAAVWLSAVEGEVNGNYRDHWQAGWCVILKISANL